MVEPPIEDFFEDDVVPFVLGTGDAVVERAAGDDETGTETEAGWVEVGAGFGEDADSGTVTVCVTGMETETERVKVTLTVVVSVTVLSAAERPSRIWTVRSKVSTRILIRRNHTYCMIDFDVRMGVGAMARDSADCT